MQIARNSELDSLKNLIRVSNGILITGQPGSGKTDLIEQLLNEYNDRQIYQTFCSAYPPGRTFKPVIDIVSQIFDLNKQDGIDKKQKAVEQKLKELDIGDIGTFYLAILDFLGLNEEESILEKIELPIRVEIIINSITETLKHISWNKPVVIAIEDAENLDASSLNFIQNLMYKLIEENILFLFSSSLPQINLKGIKEFELRSIAMDKLEAIVNEVTEETIKLPPTTPFHVAQYLHLYGEEKNEFFYSQYRGQGAVTSFSITFHDLKTVIKRRLELLNPEHRELLYSLAVVGIEIDPDDVPIGEKAFLLEHLTDSYYLRHYQDHYAFASPQLHGEIYNLIEDTKSRHLHFADYYRRLAGFEDVAAFHYLQGENYKKSIEFLMKAASIAIRRGGHDSGIYYYNQALELCQHHKDIADLEVLVALNEGLADVYRALGDEEKALKYYKVVLDSYKEILKE
jgi:GTPase SAR1 family protein